MGSQQYVNNPFFILNYYAVYAAKTQNITPEQCLDHIATAFSRFSESYRRNMTLGFSAPMPDTLAFYCYLYAQGMTDQSFHQVVYDAIDLHKNKNAGYSGEHSDPWHNFKAVSIFFGVSPLQGVLARMTDKFMRMENIRKNPDFERVNERLLDTVLDLASYALIYQCLQEEDKQVPRA